MFAFCCGPYGPLIPRRDLFPEVLQTIRRLLIRPGRFRLERELPGGIRTHDICAPWQGTQWKRWERRSRLIREPAMPKPKHRRKADGKTVPHPGRKRGGAALVIIEVAKREADGLPPQKDVTGLPLFAAPTPRIRAGKRPAPSSD